jgi:hypothetical protein
MSRRSFACILGRHSWSYAIIAGDPMVVRWCSSCLHPPASGVFPATRLDKPPTSDATPLAVAYDLVAALAAGDLAAVNQALQNTSAVQVAVVAIVLAKAPPISDVRSRLQLLAIQAEIDAIDITEEGSDL